MKECKKGYYYCTKEKKCMPIPSGYRVGYGGWLRPEKKNGNGKNGNGNGNGSHNGNGNGNGNGGGNGGGNGNGGGGGVSEGVKLRVEIPKSSLDFNLGLMFRESLDYDSGMLFIFEEVGPKSFHMKDTRIPLDIAFIKEDGVIESIKELKPFTLLPISSDGDVRAALEVNRGWFIENKIKPGHKIVKKKSLKWDGITEDVKVEDSDGNLKFEVIDLIKPDRLEPTQQTVHWEDPTELKEVRRVPNYNKPGNILEIYLAWRGKTMSIQMFFPSAKKPSRKEVLEQLQKVYPGAKLWSYRVAEYDPQAPLLQTGD